MSTHSRRLRTIFRPSNCKGVLPGAKAFARDGKATNGDISPLYAVRGVIDEIIVDALFNVLVYELFFGYGAHALRETHSSRNPSLLNDAGNLSLGVLATSVKGNKCVCVAFVREASLTDAVSILTI
jgi:hypothetical protein